MSELRTSKRRADAVLFRQPIPRPGEFVKKAVSYSLLALLLWLPAHAAAQSNAHADYKHQHKSAQKYQKSLMKERHKQEKVDAKRAKAYRKQHQ